jgi:hypothetical protein
MRVGESDRAIDADPGEAAGGRPWRGKGSTEQGDVGGGHMGGAQKPKAMSPELRRLAEKARMDHRVQFTSLAPLLTVEALEAA